MDSLSRLAASVLIRAYRDATKGTDEERDEARQWLTGGSEDFSFWCKLADLDPGLARRAVTSELTRSKKYCALPASGSRIRFSLKAFARKTP